MENTFVSCFNSNETKTQYTFERYNKVCAVDYGQKHLIFKNYDNLFTE